MTHHVVFRNRWLPYVLVFPQVAVTLVFFFWPAFQSLRLSFFMTSPFGDRLIYVALRNFERLFTSPEYLRAVINTLVFSFGVTALGLVFSLVVAVLANQQIRGLMLYRTALLWPYGIAPPVAGIIWLFLFHPSYGIVPYTLSYVTDFPLNWFVDGRVAMALVIVTATWTHLGYNIAFFLAGLQLIPSSLLDAASVDGASSFRRFWSITLPLLSPVTFFLFVMNMTYALFDTFGVIHAVTLGGPGGSTEILVYKTYKDGFIAMDLGFSAAQSVVLMALAILLTGMQFRFAERRVNY